MQPFDKRAVYDELDKASDFLHEQNIDYCEIYFHETKEEVPCPTHRVTAGMYRTAEESIHICIQAIKRELQYSEVFDVAQEMFQHYGVQLTYINYALWALFHELGHHYYKSIQPKKYNSPDYERAIDAVRINEWMYGNGSYEAHKSYRMIPSERDADEYAFDLLHKYLNN